MVSEEIDKNQEEEEGAVERGARRIEIRRLEEWPPLDKR